MSTAFAATAKVLSENSELRAKVAAAGSAEERASILRAAGVPVPTHADVNVSFANMAGVAGGNSSHQTTVAYEAGGSAAVAAAAAGAA